MLPIEFIATDLHFAVSLLAALACAAISWLYLDAWLSEGHPPKELWKWTGFAIIALGFAASATEVEPSFLPHSLLAYAGLAGTILRCLGYAGLVVGLTLDRLEPIPAVPGLQLGDAPESDAPAAPKAPALAAWGAGALHFTAAALAGAASYYYWHRATVGLERHLKPVAWATAWIALFELLDAASLFTSPFGLVWVSKLLVLAIGTLVLSAWVWRYLTKRLQTQLFMVLSAASFAIFTATIISFTFLLMSRVQATAFDSLGTTAKVLDYAVAGQLSSVTADAAGAAQDPAVVAATASADSSRLGTYLKDYLRTQGRSSLIITDDAGKILWRAENPADHTSLADNTLFDRAAVGQTAAGLAALTTPSSQLMFEATAPIRDSTGSIIGTATVGQTGGHRFAADIEQATGLAVSLYSGSTRTASTFAADVADQPAGAGITSLVLDQGHTWTGRLTADHRTYLAVYLPLRDIDNVPIGMLFVGQPQVDVLQTAARSIEITFLVAVLLLLVSIVPIYLIASYLARQLR